MHFFQPAVVNIQNDSGAAASEFPLIYYLAACGYQLLGVQEGLLRSLNFLFFALGLYCFSRLLLRLLDDQLLAVSLPMLLLGSPALAFYAFNFLPNTPALGMVLLGIAAYGQYLHRKRARDYYWAVAGFSLAGLLKITLLVPFLAGLGTYVLSQLFPRREATSFVFFPSRSKILWACLFVLGLPLLWVLWSKSYNLENQSGIFLRDAYRPEHVAMRSLNPAFYETAALQEALSDGGVAEGAKVISLPDKSPNLTLYYLRRRGWTEIFNGDQFSHLRCSIDERLFSCRL
ncbi:MAG: hypothetical protein AAGG75_16990 [Bacteroidota bacterium]